MTTFRFWNIRGLNKPLKQKEIRHLISHHNLSMLCILEMKIKDPKKDWLLKHLVQDWEFVTKYDNCFNGRIWIGWNSRNLTVTKLDASQQAIHTSVHLSSSSLPFHVTFVYGSNDKKERRLLWDNLRHTEGYVGSLPWCICGDFNEVRSGTEVSIPNSPSKSCMLELDSTILLCELTDLRFNGILYTWCNKQTGVAAIAKKLDRTLVNSS